MKKWALIIALLAPMLMSAQMMMFLNRPAPLVGNGNSFSGANYTNDVACFYGDSITIGYLITDTNNDFASLLSAQLSMVQDNQGNGGSQIADDGESGMVTDNDAIYATNVSVWLAGYNDMRYYGSDPAALSDNTAALESLVAWLALPTTERIPWYDGVTLLGNWSNRPLLGSLAYSQSAGDTAIFSFSGTTLLIGTARAGDAGIATVVVDGTVSNNYSCLRTAADTFRGINYSAGLIIVTNLPDSLHTVTFTSQSASNTFLCWYAGYSTSQLPKVVLCGTLKMPEFEYQYAGRAPFTNGTDLAADQYSCAVSNVAATLSAAGLNVKWVPAPVLDTNTDWEEPDWTHPNESGHLKIKNALLNGF